MRHASTAIFALCALLGCHKSEPTAPAAAQGPGAPASAQTGAPAPAPAGASKAFVCSVTVVRKEASDAAKVPGSNGKDVSNYVNTLYRGEQVDILEAKDPWVRVRSSDDKEGWLKRSAILDAEGVTEATVLAQSDVFDRPDLLASNSKKKIEPGTLVLVVKSKPPFAEVNVSGSQDAWVLAERLTSGEKEVMVAKLIEKSRYLVRANKREEAMQNLALLRANFQGISLVETLATELGAGAPTATPSPETPAPTPPVNAPAEPQPAPQ